MTGALARLVRRLNWSRRRWSPQADQAFHESIFSGATYDPTDSSYPGRLTIRRFADLASPCVAASGTVVDLGCGPAEITCELARRHPTTTFVGVDHSTTAIERATALASRLALANTTFVAADITTWTPPGRVDLVVMFDAFHHVPQPASFVRRLSAHTDRFFLIEPAGNWYGGWQQTFNLDWVAESVLRIRDRLEQQLNDTPIAPAPAGPSGHTGEPIEHRYPLEEFERFFEGYGLELRGTAAGVEAYGTAPSAKSDLRREVGEITYELFVRLDDLLYAQGLDLGAKHWTIYAERGRVVPRRNIPPARSQPVDSPVTGAYDAAYVLEDSPSVVAPGVTFSIVVEVTNRGWQTWTSDGPSPIFLSSHVEDERRRPVIGDGPRTPWPRAVGPGERCGVNLSVQAPSQPGRYRVLVDGVHEGRTWFSQAGVPPMVVEIVVKG